MTPSHSLTRPSGHHSSPKLPSWWKGGQTPKYLLSILLSEGLFQAEPTFGSSLQRQPLLPLTTAPPTLTLPMVSLEECNPTLPPTHTPVWSRLLCETSP